MAKRRKKQENQPELVAVGKYYLPASISEMYRILRETIEVEILTWAQEKFQKAEYLETEEDEWIVAYNGDEPVWRYRLDPTGIANAQKAHDKQAMSEFLDKTIKA